MKLKDKYIIVELIPTSKDPLKGDIIQLSALKINNNEIIDRFDYRLNNNFIVMKQLIDLINYDIDKFIYKDSTKEIIDAFKLWVDDYILLIIDNDYTKRYLNDFSIKESIFNYLDMEYNDYILDYVFDKYNLKPSNYIVDLLYEALMFENKE